MTSARSRGLRLARFALLGAGLCAPLSVARTVRASSPADAAAAQGLFDESKRLLTSGQYAAACPKLEESERLDPSPSTEFYLADCYQHVGQTASAWALFLQVASESKAAGRSEREQFARKRADQLAQKLARLIIAVPAASTSPGFEVKRDGKLVGAGQWGTPVPVDPGKHTVSATAPNHVDWSQTVNVPDGARTTTVDVPPLAPAVASAATPVAITEPPPAIAPVSPGVDRAARSADAPSAAASPSPAAADSGSRGGGARRTIALVAGGAGIAAIGAGAFFGTQAISKNNDSKSNGCNGGNLCDAAGYAARNDAKSDATISTVLVGAGAAALVGGVVLWLTAPSRATPSGAAAPPGVALGVAPNGVFLRGVFE